MPHASLTCRLAVAYSDSEKDRIEAEVGLFVKTCTQQIERLKNSVLAAQAAQAQGGASNDSRSTGVNVQTIAHLHGVVSQVC